MPGQSRKGRIKMLDELLFLIWKIVVIVGPAIPLTIIAVYAIVMNSID